MKQEKLFKLTVSGLLIAGFASSADAELKNVVVSAPENATVSITKKKGSKHYVAFETYDHVSKEVRDGMQVLTYELETGTSQYCYRVSRAGNLTQAGLFSASKTDIIEVSEESLGAHTNRYFNHEVWGNGTNYADIFLNINKRNLLRLKTGDTFQIVNLRTWQLTNNSSGNYFIEPDFRYNVLDMDFKPDDSIIEVDRNGIITAKKAGTAIVQVRYDGIKLETAYGSMWSEIWAENTGTFVVTVDADAENSPADNIRLAYKPAEELDCEHDILYYMCDEPGYELTFTPDEGSSVTVANPLVDAESNNVAYPEGFSAENVTVNADGSVTVLLTFGRNIIRTADTSGNANYQVLSAKPVEMNLVKVREDDYVLPGDNVKMEFKGLYHVAGKLAGLYNSTCYIQFNGKSNGTSMLGEGQYDFAGNAKAQTFPISISPTATGDSIIGSGCLNPLGFGSKPSVHRGINYVDGINPNFNAGTISGQFGSIPEQTIHVTPLQDMPRLFVSLEANESRSIVNMSAVKAAFGESVAWESSDESVATVDENGKVTGINPGVAVISALRMDTRDASPAITCDVSVGGVSVGIEDVSTENTESVFYPNPCNGVLYVDSASDSDMDVYSLSGSRMMSVKIEEGTNTVDVSHLASGMYIVRIGGKTDKLIVR